MGALSTREILSFLLLLPRKHNSSTSLLVLLRGILSLHFLIVHLRIMVQEKAQMSLLHHLPGNHQLKRLELLLRLLLLKCFRKVFQEFMQKELKKADLLRQ